MKREPSGERVIAWGKEVDLISSMGRKALLSRKNFSVPPW
jgi:hypothetical protein